MKASLENTDKHINNNLSLWNNWARINYKTAFYDIEGFKIKKNSLKEIELKEVGSVQGKSLLHLQCHMGQDSISWAHLGAKVTGVDLSNQAIELATQLSQELNIPAQFICSDVLKVPEVLQQKFDIVFTSYGVISWLADLDKWAQTIVHCLKPGGFFYIVEFHPFTNMFNAEWTELTEAYSTHKHSICSEVNGSYADFNEKFSHLAYEWSHSLSDIVNALRKEGLILEFLHEFTYSNYNCFPNLEEIAAEKYVLKGQNKKFPLMFSIKATYRPDLKL